MIALFCILCLLAFGIVGAQAQDPSTQEVIGRMATDAFMYDCYYLPECEVVFMLTCDGQHWALLGHFLEDHMAFREGDAVGFDNNLEGRTPRVAPDSLVICVRLWPGQSRCLQEGTPTETGRRDEPAERPIPPAFSLGRLPLCTGMPSGSN